MAGWALVYLGLVARPGDRPWMVLVFTLPYAAALAVRRRWPVAAAAVACAALAVVWPLGLAPTVSGPLAIPFFWTPFLLAYSFGAGAGLAVGLTGTVLLAVCLLLANAGVFNPLDVVMTVGPWLAGRVVLSRRTMTEQLQARNEELRAEQELFALESVRYERARIARELHDIVAHCLSVMVVQASAGQRVAAADRDGVAEALESVAEAAAQAQTEIGRLVELLSGGPPAGRSPCWRWSASSCAAPAIPAWRSPAGSSATAACWRRPCPRPPIASSRKRSPTRSSTRRARRARLPSGAGAPRWRWTW